MGFVVLVIFVFLGGYIFVLYSISIDAFRIMGGIIFFRSGLKMLESIVPRTRTTPKETEEGLSHNDIAISPIGIPIITGPGAITAAMVLSGETDGIIQQGILLVSIAIAVSYTHLTLPTTPYV